MEQIPAGMPSRAPESMKDVNQYGIYIICPLIATTLIRCFSIGRMVNALPADVIKNICEEFDDWPEDPQPGVAPMPSLARRKHSKNRGILSASHVCKSWRSNVVAFKCLWQDIAFIVAEPKTTRLAATFLSFAEDHDLPLHIYAAFGQGTLPVDPTVTKLLRDLRHHMSRWGIFEYQGTLGRYHLYLDLPAPNIRYLAAYGNSSRNVSQLFSGHMPSLCSLLVSSTRFWDSMMLPNLTNFHLGQSAYGHPPSLDSLLRFFQCTPRLETLRLEQLGLFVHDCAPDTTVPLSQLHDLQARNTDFGAVSEHILIPNVRKASFTVDMAMPTHPSFSASHALAGLSSIPILDLRFSKVMVIVACPTDEGTFSIYLEVAGGGSFQMRFDWGTGGLQQWKGYVTKTLSVLTERIQLDDGVVLHLYLGICCKKGAWRIHRGFARNFFRTLVTSGTTLSISSFTARRLLITNHAPALDEDETQMFRLCLRSRPACKAGLFVRAVHCTLPWHPYTDSECTDECGYILCV